VEDESASSGSPFVFGWNSKGVHGTWYRLVYGILEQNFKSLRNTEKYINFNA